MRKTQYADLPVEDVMRHYASEQADPFTYAVHKARYEFARDLLPAAGSAAADTAALDIGCAYGFGAAILSERAVSVTALDAHPDVVAVARQRFPLPDIRFESGDCLQRDYPDAAFDLITAFEVIEHLKEPRAMLARCFRWLRPGGTLVISTPNKLVHLLMGIVWEFHEREYGYSDLWALLRDHVPESNIQLLGQNPYMLEHWRNKLGRFKPYATPLRRLVWATVPRTLIVAARRIIPKRPPAANPHDPVLRQALTISPQNVDLCDTFIAIAKKPEEA